MQPYFRDLRRCAYGILLLVLLYQAVTPVASSAEIVIQPGPTLAANRPRSVIPPVPEPIDLLPGRVDHTDTQSPLANNTSRIPIELATSAQNGTEATATRSQDNQDANLPVIIPQPVRRPTYSQVYQSIPFSRSEYRANPSYRHEATMEILFGQLRPMSINRYYQQVPQTERYRVTYPYLYPPNLYYPFTYPRPSLYRRY